MKISSLFSRILLYWNTIKYLKKVQIFYQIWYRSRKNWRLLIRFKYPLSLPSSSKSIILIPWIEKQKSYSALRFIFLNQEVDYEEEGKIAVDWNEMRFGRLWAYNLNYMDYLLQPGINNADGNKLIENFVSDLPDNYIGLEPYTISLRAINWIKYFSTGKIKTAAYDNCLYAQYKILIDSLEYHILGNHLLVNGFSLLFGSFYFNEKSFFEAAHKILTNELNEQVLYDGGHFELSTMYHQIVLEGLLDSINLIQNNYCFSSQESLLLLLQEKAKKMIFWINAMTFSNRLVPLLNDSAYGIAPSTDVLNEYSKKLGLISADQIINIQSVKKPNFLRESGYRRFNSPAYECILDVGQIGAYYQPGHAHADTFNFCLCVHNEPLIIDPGVSTYENNTDRQKQRSTSMHNTVTVQHKNSSEVWSSFRVGRRAKTIILDESKNHIHAKHDGYSNLTHFRKWQFNEEKIEIEDVLKGMNDVGTANFIIHPGIKPVVTGTLVQTRLGIFEFINGNDIKIIQIKVPGGFNKFFDSWKVEITFSVWLKTIIHIKPNIV